MNFFFHGSEFPNTPNHNCTSSLRRGKAEWARLGDLDVNTDQDNENVQHYKIIHIISHPSHKSPDVYNDIALFKLQTTVKFNDFVRPICLATSAVKFDENQKAVIVGYGFKNKSTYE